MKSSGVTTAASAYLNACAKQKCEASPVRPMSNAQGQSSNDGIFQSGIDVARPIGSCTKSVSYTHLRAHET